MKLINIYLILIITFILISSLSFYIYFFLSKQNQIFTPRYIDYTYDSLIMTSPKDIQLLNKWINELSIQKHNITLLYRLSRDKSDPRVFHSLCDTIPNTLTVIKLVNDTIIGGYTESTWDGFGFKNDSNAFIFNLAKEKQIKIFKVPHAIFASPYFLPIFGERDIFCDNDKFILSNFPRCYGEDLLKSDFLNEKMSSQFIESMRMELIDLEVFKLH